MITELSREFGAQAVVLAIDAKRNGGDWDVMVRGGRESALRDAVEWAKSGVALGAGEIMLTSVDRDGTQIGFDTELTAEISTAVSVPVIASGGAKLPEHFVEIFKALGFTFITLDLEGYRTGSLNTHLVNIPR